MNIRKLRALLGALSICATAAGVAATPQYAIVDLGSIDAAGAGLSWLNRQPFYQQQVVPPAWPGAGPCGSDASLLGAQFGDVAVGAMCLPGGGDEAAKWTLSSSGSVSVTPLGFLPGAGVDPGAGVQFSVAFDVNSLGDIVGESNSRYLIPTKTSGDFAQHGFIYTNGTWTELIPIAGVNYQSMAEGINDSREVVGQTDTISSTSGATLNRAFMYVGGTMYNLTFYLVGGPTVLLSDAYGIDCQGNIAAIGTPAAGGTTHSYLLTRQGAARTTCPK
jgi:probable HAF family extracellular repeat protein